MDSATHNGEGGVGPIHRDHEGLGTWGMVRVPSLPCLLAWLAVPSERREIPDREAGFEGIDEAIDEAIEALPSRDLSEGPVRKKYISSDYRLR